jgi:CheY-like chemotaxis protein
LIDAWVKADRSQSRKQRHTGTRIHERLRDEYGFTVSVSAVRRYLAHRKQTQGEVFFPLQFDAGEEGQVDWGQAWYLINGVEQKGFLFCLRLCYSSVSYVCAYFQEVQACFLDGHVNAFAFLGGVPRQLAYDNLKSAIITVGPGQDRRLNRHFVALRSHYLMEEKDQDFALGASDYLTKPIDREHMRRTLNKYRSQQSIQQVLVVEDDPDARDLIERAVADLEWQVSTAANGQLALERMVEHRPDLIFIELMMPEMDGFEFVLRMRQNPDWHAIPIVVITAKDLNQEDRTRLNGHVQNILQKGAFSRSELHEKVRRQVATYVRGTTS